MIALKRAIVAWKNLGRQHRIAAGARWLAAVPPRNRGDRLQKLRTEGHRRMLFACSGGKWLGNAARLDQTPTFLKNASADSPCLTSRSIRSEPYSGTGGVFTRCSTMTI